MFKFFLELIFKQIAGAVRTASTYNPDATLEGVAPGDIMDDAIEARHIGDAEIVNAAIGDLAIDTAQIAASAVTTAKIADVNVTTAKMGLLSVDATILAAAAVETAKIKDAAVENAKLGLLSVDTAQIALLAVDTGQLAADAVETAKIKDAQVTTAKMGLLSVDATILAAAAVETAKIKDDAVTTAKILDGNVTAAKFNASSVTVPKLGITPKAAGLTYGPLACAVIDGAQLEALFDTVTNNVWPVATGDVIVDIVLVTTTATGGACTADVGLDAAAGAPADPNGFIEAADVNAVGTIAMSDAAGGNDGAYYRNGMMKIVAADGFVTLTTNNNLAGGAFIGYAYMLYMPA